jgi:hypothetical protein
MEGCRLDPGSSEAPERNAASRRRRVVGRWGGSPAPAIWVGALLCASVSLGSQTKDDPLIGRWLMDRAKSEFSGTPPERRVTIFEMLPDGRMRQITETVIANGSTDRVEYAAKFDEKDNPISNSFLSTVSVKRIDARTTERQGKVKAEVVETSKRTVSADGRTLTITTNGINDGTEYSSVQVFTRETP